MELLSVGTEIYYHGDMANLPDFGRITDVIQDKWGMFYNIQLNDGREIKRFPAHLVKDRYQGHAGTRIVTKRAYLEYRQKMLDSLSERIAAA